MTAPALSDAKSRALRTLGQNLLLDVGVAVATVALPAVQSEHVDYRLLGLALAKTALVTAVAFGHRRLNELKAKNRDM
jgi:hypothetical protein